MWAYAKKVNWWLFLMGLVPSCLLSFLFVENIKKGIEQLPIINIVGGMLLLNIVFLAFVLYSPKREKFREDERARNKAGVWNEFRNAVVVKFSYNLPETEAEFIINKDKIVAEAQVWVDRAMKSAAEEYWAACGQETLLHVNYNTPQLRDEHEREFAAAASLVSGKRVWFWYLDTLAKKIGCTTKPSFKDWLPWPNVMH